MAEPEADESVHVAARLLLGVRSSRIAPMRALGIDVGGTFTDAVLVEDGEIRIAKVPTAARQEESVVAAAAARRSRGRRPLHARHDDRDERAPAAARRANGARDERGLRARPPPPPADAGAPVPAVRRAPAAARPARALRRRARAHRARTASSCRSTSTTLPELDAEAIAVSLLFSFRDRDARAARRRGAAAPLSVRPRRRVARGRAGVPRVRARLDDGGRRVPRPGALRATSARSRERAPTQGSRHRS